MRLHRIVFLLTVVVPLAAAPQAPGCVVPVFRYAMERWEPASYGLFVVHRGGLEADTVAAMKAAAETRANLVVGDVDLSAAAADNLPAVADLFLDRIDTNRLPQAVLLFPAEICVPDVDPVAWQGDATPEALAAIVDSPVRRALVGGLTAGKTAVWVLLKCGDAEKDGAARKLLETQLAFLEKELRLNEAFTAIVAEPGSDIRIDFSVLELDRNDPAEAVLASLLTGSDTEPDVLRGNPAAFAVFGRGRAFVPLIGEGITEDFVTEVCEFLTGDCSCVVKEQNPGIDLLLSADWDGVVDHSFVSQATDMPSIWLSEAETGTVAVAAAAAAAAAGPLPEPDGTAPVDTAPDTGTRPIWVNMALTAAIVLGGLAILSWLLMHHNRESKR
jgi:hypothetical protein